MMKLNISRIAAFGAIVASIGVMITAPIWVAFLGIALSLIFYSDVSEIIQRDDEE